MVTNAPYGLRQAFDDAFDAIAPLTRYDLAAMEDDYLYGWDANTCASHDALNCPLCGIMM